MNKLKLSCLAIASVFLIAAMFAQSTFCQQQTRATALDSELSPGHNFNLANTWRLLGVDDTQVNAGTWMQIPTWLAGSWKSDGYEITESSNDRTGTTNNSHRYQQSPGSKAFGHIRDFEDNVWWYRRTAAALTEDDPNVVTLIYFHEPTSVTSYAAILRMKFVRFTLTGSSSEKKIKEVVQVDEYAHYLPTAKGMYTQTRVHAFDWQGNPRDSSTQASAWYLAKPFQPDERYANSFRLFQEKSAQAYEP